MAGGDLAELRNEERCAFLCVLGRKNKKVLEFLDFFLALIDLKLITLRQSILRVLRGGCWGLGERISPPWGPGFLGYSANVTAHTDVEHQDCPFQVSLTHKTPVLA